MPSNILSEASYADDCVFPFFPPAKDLVKKTAQAVAIIDRVFSSHGLTLNFSKGKPEVMLFKGKGAYKYKTEYQQEFSDGIPFTTDTGETKNPLRCF